MATVDTDSILDLVRFTLKELGQLRATDLASSLQDYCILRHVMKEEKMTHGSGQGIQFNAITSTNGSARTVGLYEPDNVNRVDVGKTGTVPWRHFTWDYAIDEREIKMNSGPSKIFDLLETQRIAAWIDGADLVEAQGWGTPSSSTDVKNLWGIWYWLVYNATEGFNGGTQSGFSDVAGINTTTYPAFKNWTAQYTNISKDDLIRKVRKAATYTKFKPPVDMKQYANGEGRYGYYTNYDVIQAIEEALEDQNQNLGKDVASMDGQALFRRVPIEWVPQLDATAADPFIGINWDTFHFEVLEGYFMKEFGPKRLDQQHNTIAVHVDTTGNFVCRDRRKNFLVAKSDPTTT